MAALSDSYLLDTLLGHVTITLAEVLIFSFMGGVKSVGLCALVRRVSVAWQHDVPTRSLVAPCGG